jgi:dolichyl-phosphate-mannose-protein mannosyltransferase
MESALTLMQKKLWIILLAISAVTSFAWLHYPQQVVFDEVHFGKFITSYCCSGERFFDIHPPHGKLLIAAGAYVGGYRGGESFEHIGQSYGDIPVAALRFIPALAGAFIPLLVFVLLRQVGVSQPLAFLGGLVFALDNAFTLQSRVISLDTLLVAVTLGSLSAFFAALQSVKYRQWYILAAGALAGLAGGIKFTGLAILVLLGILVGYYLFASKTKYEAREWIQRGLVILAAAFVVYVAGWMVHFSLLTEPGPGDAWGVPTGNFVQDMLSIHERMFQANYGLDAAHAYGSMWWTWPLMQRPIFYWQDNGAMVYFLGNPAVWWGGSILFLTAIIAKLTRVPAVRSSNTLGWIFLAGYIVSFLPFVQVPRVLFLYHYMTPLVFSVLFGIWWLNSIVVYNKWFWQVYGFGIAFLVAGFLLFSPLTYGFAAPQWQQWLFWFSTWR